MNKHAIKEMMFGGINELMRNKDYYYHSSVGATYSHWTERGREALNEYMDFMAWKMREAEEAELDARAKDMVMKELKV